MADCGTFVNFLDLNCWFTHTLFGSPELFVFALLIAVGVYAIVKDFHILTLGVLVALGASLFYTEAPWAGFITALILGVAIAFQIGKKIAK